MSTEDKVETPFAEEDMSADALQHMHECIVAVNTLNTLFDARILAGVLTMQAGKLYSKLAAAGYYTDDQLIEVGMQFLERALRRSEPPKIVHVTPEEFAETQTGDVLGTSAKVDKSKLN